jgi:hypothetical protein
MTGVEHAALGQKLVTLLAFMQRAELRHRHEAHRRLASRNDVERVNGLSDALDQFIPVCGLP